MTNGFINSTVLESFNKQTAMKLIKATMPVIESGKVEIHLPHWSSIEQQHGFIHGGVVSMIADSAAGYAAKTLIPEGDSVLAVEFKLNFLRPAKGDKLIAVGSVIKPGRTLTITKAEVFAVVDGTKTLCAVMQQTIMVMRASADK